MGVTGLTPFLKKICPEVIKTLPERLQAFAGKTIVIDGTLITQRLHFAPTPQSHRHVLGWYHIIKELRECDVHAICVFDGKERSWAKEHEMQRRRNIRQETAARGALEAERLSRLRTVATLLPVLPILDSSQRESLAEILKTNIGKIDINSDDMRTLSAQLSSDSCEAVRKSYPSDIDAEDISLPHELLGDSQSPDVDDATSAGEPATSIDDSQRRETSRSEDTIQGTTEDPGPDDRPSDDLPNSEMPQPKEAAVAPIDEKPAQIVPDPYSQDTTPTAFSRSPDIIFSSIVSLFLDYRQSISKLTALPEPETVDSSTVPLTPELSNQEDDALETKDLAEDSVVAEEQVQYVMSKTQHQVTLSEGSFWRRLPASTVSDEGIESAKSVVAALIEKSSRIRQTYWRRTHPPTAETYMESKEILRAMGIPCIDSTGPYEAEALASSLVVSGYADYVASEDMDVLIYEAPLIRNLASRNGPLVVISGTEVRDRLQLDRARFVDFALLLGTDFSQRIKKLGPSHALKFIQTHGSIERVLECETRYSPHVSPQAYLAQIISARLAFSTLPPLPDPELLRQMPYEQEEVDRVLTRYGLQREAETAWDSTAALSGNFFEDDPAV